MKVVLVIDQFDDSNNGTTVTARRLAENLRTRGNAVTILAGGKPEENKICARKHKIPFFQGLIEAQGMSFAKPDPALYYEAFKGADVVHFFLPFRFCRQGEKHARQMRIPCVAAFHMQPENVTSSLYMEKSRFLNSALYRWCYRVFYNRFTEIHCPSSFIAGQLEEHGYAARTWVISNGVSEAFQRVQTQKPANLQDKFMILMTGRFSREKRQDLLIQAAQKSKYAHKIQLVFAGKGPCEKKYRKLGKKLANKPIMNFFSQDELLNMLGMCDLYVHASDAEIEGISCMEAMACGLVPVISNSRLSATGQYALCNESLFEAGNAQDLADKIDYWIEKPEEKEKFSALYEKQQQKNRVSACTVKMEEMYGQAIFNSRYPMYKKTAGKRKRRWFTPSPQKLNSRILSPRKITAAITRFLASLASYIVFFFNKLCLGLKIEGRENLRDMPGGAVAVCNHVHPMDGTMLKMAFMQKQFWIISLRENFNIPVVGGLIKNLGAVALGSNIHEQAQLQRALLERIAQGDIVHYYPEGMLVPYYDGLREFHGGAFDLSVRTGCPVVPVVLYQRQGKGLYAWKRKPCFTLRVLRPLYPNRRLGTKRAKQDLHNRVRLSMEAALKEGFRVVGPTPTEGKYGVDWEEEYTYPEYYVD